MGTFASCSTRRSKTADSRSTPWQWPHTPTRMVLSTTKRTRTRTGLWWNAPVSISVPTIWISDWTVTSVTTEHKTHSRDRANWTPSTTVWVERQRSIFHSISKWKVISTGRQTPAIQTVSNRTKCYGTPLLPNHSWKGTKRHSVSKYTIYWNNAATYPAA